MDMSAFRDELVKIAATLGGNTLPKGTTATQAAKIQRAQAELRAGQDARNFYGLRDKVLPGYRHVLASRDKAARRAAVLERRGVRAKNEKVSNYLFSKADKAHASRVGHSNALGALADRAHGDANRAYAHRNQTALGLGEEKFPTLTARMRAARAAHIDMKTLRRIATSAGRQSTAFTNPAQQVPRAPTPSLPKPAVNPPAAKLPKIKPVPRAK